MAVGTSTLTNRRTTSTRATADWQPGEYGVLDLDRICPTGPCAARAPRDAWLPEVLDALAQDEAA